jgi:hypothetical protein
MFFEKKGCYSLLDDVDFVERCFLYKSDVKLNQSYWCYLPYHRKGNFNVRCKYYLKLGVVVYKDESHCLLRYGSSLFYLTYDCLYRDYIEACYYVNEHINSQLGIYRVRNIR